MQHPLREKFLLFQIRTRRSPDAFARIYDTYATVIYRFIAYKVPSREIAEDLTSDTFLKAWQFLKDGQRAQSIRPLLYAIARNVVTDYYRANAKMMGDVSLDETFLEREQDSEPLSAAVASEEVDVLLDLEKVRAALGSLKDGYREVIVMKYLDELSTSEIGTVLGKPSANIRLLLHRALAALKHILTHAPETAHNPAQEPRGEQLRDVAASGVARTEQTDIARTR